MSEPERLFLLGLLADLGHMVMYLTIPDEALGAAQLASASHRPLHLVERETIGCDHGEVGAALLSQWRLPDSFARAVASQFEPKLAGSGAREASIVYLANQIAQADREGRTSAQVIEECDPTVWVSRMSSPTSSRSFAPRQNSAWRQPWRFSFHAEGTARR